MKRAIIIVIDALGIGALPDAEEYGDSLECNTLGNVAKVKKGLHLPNMEKMGLGNIYPVEGIVSTKNTISDYGKMSEVSKGKDTTVGHWEIAGLIISQPFRTYPNGFPDELINKFIIKTKCKKILGNYPASGTEIIKELGSEHCQTGYPIIYTSADSVFQIACHVDVISIDTLYQWCEIARRLLGGKYNVCRVIARPFGGTQDDYNRISALRKDYSMKPPEPTILNRVLENKGRVLAIGKIEDIFARSGISHSVHTGNNKEGLDIIFKAIKGELALSDIIITDSKNEYVNKELIFANLVDTDMLYGHRNDAIGYGNALEEIDYYIGMIIRYLNKDDLLIITGDHGCDPTMPGTDHTREYVPVLVYHLTMESKNLGILRSFSYVAERVEKWLGLS